MNTDRQTERCMQHILDADSLQQMADGLGAYLEDLLVVRRILAVRFDSQNQCRELGGWGKEKPADLEESLRIMKTVFEELQSDGGEVTEWKMEEAVRKMTESEAGEDRNLVSPVYYKGNFSGVVIFMRWKEDQPWNEEEERLIGKLTVLIGIWFYSRNLNENYELQNWVYNTMMDRMQTNLYVTDIRTDKILFMNKTMQNAFGIRNPEGKICWQVLQKGLTGRCPGCPVEELRRKDTMDTYVRWEEHNSVTGRFYENYDSLMRWSDGRTVHFQHSMDVTDSKKLSRQASTDELTGLLNRRGGKMRLAEYLSSARTEHCKLTVCMYDVNSLKKVNDTYGHREGDNLLCVIANAVKSVLGTEDFACRLSGDEFLVVFADKGEEEARERIRRVEDLMKMMRRQDRIPYELSFCIGYLELLPGHTKNLTEILREVDERMYEEKRLYHMRLGSERAKTDGDKEWKLVEPEAFDYDEQYLYEALVKSTDDYLYVCDMATNTFRYSKNLVEEFGLPGEVIRNAADIWKNIIHPEDWDRFFEANRAVSDGEVLEHQVEYRAKNRCGRWIKLRCRGHVVQNAAGDPRVFAGFITNLGEA